MISLTDAVKQFYGLEVTALPKVTCTDGAQAPESAMAYLLTAHEELQAQLYQEQPDVVAAYPSSGICEHAAEILALLDQKCFQSALRTLADENLGLSGRSKKMFLAYPICRYADEDLMAELTSRAPKWASSVSGNDAPPLRTFRKAALYSETRAAMLFADKFGDLDVYAGIRGTDGDTIRDQFLSNIGLDESGGKAYDLGNQTVTARLQKDLSFLVELPAGKTAKSLPKKGADAEKYAAANADFSEMKKNAKKIVKNRVSILFADFLSGRARKADAWKESYLKNPLLRQVASLLVWAQEGVTFTILNREIIANGESPVTLTDAPIRLAHPMEMNKALVESWQKYFAAKGLKQMFPQIWEPVFDPESVREDRYRGCTVPVLTLSSQKKHGIGVDGLSAYSESFELWLTDCELEAEPSDWRYVPGVNDDFYYTLGKFTFTKYTRWTNHIVGWFDRYLIADKIKKDDVSVCNMLSGFSLAQITEFIKVATENNCTNVAALLLDYKNQNFADFDPMEEFSLEL